MPWHLAQFTPEEYAAMAEVINARVKAAEKQQREMGARH